MGKKKKKQAEEAGPPGAPEWVVTFTDMISLLVTFFVLLMTFSSIEKYNRLRVDGWLRGTKGVINDVGGDFAYQTLEEDLISATDIRRGAMRPHSRPFQHLQENLEEMGQKKTDEHLEYDFKDIQDGLQIVFDDAAAFAPGSAEPNEELKTSLGELARVMQFYPHLVVVEGFTDGAFRPTPDFASAEELSLARAAASVQVMLAESEISPELIQAAALGDTRPRAEDETPEGRRTNRRVEVRVIALSKARADYLEAERRKESG